MTTIQKVLAGAGTVVVGYQLYKHFSKPKSPQAMSNAIGKAAPQQIIDGKVYTKKSNVWTLETKQPSPMSWYLLNGKYRWVKWDGNFASS